MADSTMIFDRRAVRHHRDRAAASDAADDFLRLEIAEQMAERLRDTGRNFRAVLDIGRGCGESVEHSVDEPSALLVRGDLAEGMLRRRACPAVAFDDEFLPFADGAFDLVLSRLVLHWVNDVPGALVQIRRSLRPDGLFIGALLGGDTLIELRDAFLGAESEVTGGASPRTSPMAAPPDAVALMQRAGFALPVVDVDTVTATYSDLLALMHDLRAMGETNAVLQRSRNFLRRDMLGAAADRYRAVHGGPDGRIPATFQIIWMTGWAPDDAQPRPLRPGSAGQRLAAALGTKEWPAGEPAGS